MVRRLLCLVILLAATACSGRAASAAAACEDLLATRPAAGGTRPLTAADLLGLRDIGRPDGALVAGARPIAVSPDGREIAFMLLRADLARNSYCLGLATMSLQPAAPPRLIDRGGEIILGEGDYRGVILPTGFPALLAPAWSPDGRRLAFLRRDQGLTRLWTIQRDGRQWGEARPLADAPVDIAQFAWSPDGQGIVYALREGQMAEQAALAREGLSGFHYDARFVPMVGSTPMPLASTPLAYRYHDIDTNAERVASDAERALLGADPIHYASEPLMAIGPDGRRISAVPLTPNPASEQRLVVRDGGGRTWRCEDRSCRGRFVGLWWMPGGDALLYLRREGWNMGRMALYRWQPGRSPSRQLLATDDVISGCAVAGARLVCLQEGANQPSRLVAIDPARGRSTLLFDPNPDYATIRLGAVERLQWRTDAGLEVRGDLALPPGYDRATGGRLPLIVTTYRSNGFLRGATGNEYPIHLFAARGFAVLALDRPAPNFAVQRQEGDPEKLRAANSRGWAERRSMHSAVMNGIDAVIAMGIADPARIGITGLSDGASTTAFALINSRRFAAASISTCCLEPWSVASTIGPAFAAMMRRQGYPAATSDDQDFWAPASLIRNAGRIDTPLLMQLADEEYLTAIDVHAALRELSKPVDMYVFPHEHHNKWQPRHRMAIYVRNLDWFAFWLMGEEDPDPEKAGQYAIWRALRSGGSGALAQPGR
jgi:dipeptidyl aminopeptidase/acylaminoacyl peptidase